jgi:hypothetical protein
MIRRLRRIDYRQAWREAIARALPGGNPLWETAISVFTVPTLFIALCYQDYYTQKLGEALRKVSAALRELAAALAAAKADG